MIGYGFFGVLRSLGGGALSAKYGLEAVFVAAAAMGFGNDWVCLAVAGNSRLAFKFEMK